LCIGDAAHTTSPAGGVGINLAIQDAVAAANALLRQGNVELRHLRSVQRRREVPIRIIQRLQTLAHRRVFAPAVNSGGLPSPPAPVRALLGLRAVRDLPARIHGLRRMARSRRRVREAGIRIAALVSGHGDLRLPTEKGDRS
jgi:2-polyprenyl-6-methoxyphenol hydroxylase-like FAD-dependent oxidoreductase